MHLALLPFLAMVTAFRPVIIAPEARINVSALSDKILLVDVTKVEWQEPVKQDGLEDRKVVISGQVVEVVRGKAETKAFQGSYHTFRMVDAKAFAAAHKEDNVDVLYAACDQRTGAEDCKVGGRCIVISWRTNDYFVPVAKDDTAWRGTIRERKKEE